jgi:hypothetical protein
MRTEKELRATLDSMEQDERLWYESADVNVNSPLALIQVHLQAKANTLRWVLKMPWKKYHGEEQKKLDL